MGKDCDILVPEDFMCSVLRKPELRDRYPQFANKSLMLNYFRIIISQTKHMLWVLKRTVPMRRFFEHPKICLN